MAKRNQLREEKGKRTLFLGPFQPELETAFLEWVRGNKERKSPSSLSAPVRSDRSNQTKFEPKSDPIDLTIFHSIEK